MILFMACVLDFLGVYQKHGTQLKNLEDHKSQSAYNCSLTIKRFASDRNLLTTPLPQIPQYNLG